MPQIAVIVGLHRQLAIKRKRNETVKTCLATDKFRPRQQDCAHVSGVSLGNLTGFAGHLQKRYWDFTYLCMKLC